MRKTTFMHKLEQALTGRILFTPIELVKLGVFGSKHGVYQAIKRGLDAGYSSDQRIIILRGDLIEYLNKINS